MVHRARDEVGRVVNATVGESDREPQPTLHANEMKWKHDKIFRMCSNVVEVVARGECCES